MKTIYSFLAIIIALFSLYPKILADQVITLFLKPYPLVAKMQTKGAQQIAAKLAKAGKLSRTQAKEIAWGRKKPAGIFATYAGFMTPSDSNGQLNFPRQHSEPLVYIVVTPKIAPVVRSGNTLSHWELLPKEPVAMYKIEKKQHPQTQLFYFSVEAEPAPENKIIPLESIVIFANPKYIKVPLGVTPSIDSPHLVLPDIYVKKGISLDKKVLNILNLLQYFGRIARLYQTKPSRYSSHLTY